MAFSDVFKKLYPLIAVGASFGGPVGSMAASALGKALGVDVKPDPQAMQDAIQKAAMTDEGRLKLEQAENEFKVTMAKLGYDDAEKLAQLAVTDRDSARKREVDTKDSWTPRLLAATVVAGWVIVQGYVLPHAMNHATINPDMIQIIARLLGTLDGSLMLVLSYYFGSSAGSQSKDALLAQKGN